VIREGGARVDPAGGSAVQLADQVASKEGTRKLASTNIAKQRKPRAMRSSCWTMVLPLLFLMGCEAAPQVVRLPAYSIAIEMADPEKPFSPPLVSTTEKVGSMVCYGYLSKVETGGTPESRARALWRASVEHMPDVVAYGEGGSVYTGSVGQYWGFGVSTSTPVYGVECFAYLLRRQKAKTGLTVDKTGMIVAINPDCKAQGLLEGDKVLSINGVAWDSENWRASSHLCELLKLRPGEPAKFIAIRPGTGRVEGSITAIPVEVDNGKRATEISTKQYEVRLIMKKDQHVWQSVRKGDDSDGG